MGVHGLWDLLAPVGRRVSVDTLAGKKLAIDASIWMIQFMKAMRDEKGEMVRNAHLLGFFRRICKLLFLRTKPVFVFDGGTPALKRRTVIARRRHRENAKAKIRKTAEKLLLNHLKLQRVEELAMEIRKQRENADTMIKEIVPDKITPSVEDSSVRTADAVSSQVHVQGFKENLDAKGKQVMTDDVSSSGIIRSGFPDMHSEDLDELLAASLAAEDDFSSAGPSTTAYGEHIEEESNEDEDEDEEMILPEMKGGLDPTVLAALPPSMQLDLLVQMRERLMAENRQKYQQVKKAPSKFSELQIQSYLKTVAFRREIDEVQKAAAARGVGGVQTSRIASEANREFIFSSSFSGDKQELSSSRMERHRNDLSQGKKCISSDIIPSLLSTVGSCSPAPTSLEEQTTQNNQDIGAYVDEFGRFRMSRVRGLGIRMTRDIQRNLDLMKEFEQGKGKADVDAHKMEILGNLSDDSHFVQVEESEQDNDMTGEIETTPISGSKDGSLHTNSMLGGENTIQISFIDDGSVPAATDGDDIFAKLVAEGSVTSAENCHNSSVALPSGDDEDVDWEDGTCDVIRDASPCPNETKGIASVPDLEEEADIQEAIKRSLTELAEKKSQYNLTNDINLPETAEPHDFVKEQIDLPDIPKNSGFSRTMESCPLVDLDVITNDDCSSLLGEVNVDIDGNSIRQSPNGSKVCLDSVTSKVIDTQEPSIGSPKIISSAATETPSVRCHISGGEDCSTDPVIDKDITPQQNVSSEALKSSLNVQDAVPSTSRDSELNPANLVLDSESIFVDLKKPFEDVLTLDDEMQYLKQEREFLGNEQKKHERDAEYVSSEMFAECQELLQMFGLPYIIAPMEAEAQCAFLEMTNMVDGVVTDDSDVFLFGARSVFKNIFDDRKYVETYLMKDIETDLGLSREKLIRMALLLGSDYTEGVSGIGIVNAIEVVNAFPEDDGLQKFREWLESPDPAILGRLNTHSKKSSKGNHIEADVPTQDAQTSSPESSGFTDSKTRDNISDDKRIFMDKHRNVSKNWYIPPSFPSEAVVTAYISPKVDESTERFSWGKPGLLVLRKLCWERFGWTDQKADQLLIPVLKEYDTHETQMRLEAFYTFNEKFAKIRSQRIKKAVKGITGKDSSDLVVENMSPKSKSRKRVEEKTSKGQVGRPVETSTGTNDPSQNNKLPSGRKQTQSDICDGHFSQTEMVSISFSQKKSRQNSKRGRSQNPRGRGMGTKQRRKEKASSDTTCSSSSDHGRHMELENSKQSSVLRQSTRRRSQAKYVELDSDSDEGYEYASKEAYCSSGQEAVDVVHQGQKDNASEEKLVVQDCLLNGGGFCIDEDEPAGQHVEADTNSTMDTELETGELKLSSEPEHSLDAKNPPALDLVHEFGSDECLKSSSGEIKVAAEVSLVDPSLKSIPNLRRKRRKI